MVVLRKENQLFEARRAPGGVHVWFIFVSTINTKKQKNSKKHVMHSSKVTSLTFDRILFFANCFYMIFVVDIEFDMYFTVVNQLFDN